MFFKKILVFGGIGLLLLVQLLLVVILGIGIGVAALITGFLPAKWKWFISPFIPNYVAKRVKALRDSLK